MRRAQLLVVCFTLAAASSPSFPARADLASPEETDSGQERVKELYYEGSTLYSASDYDGAIEKFKEALHEASLGGVSPEIRGALLQNMARAHVRAHAIDQDETHLRTALDLYRRFIEESQSLGYPENEVADARERSAEIEAQLSGASNPPMQEPAPVEDPGAAPDRSSRGKTPTALIGVGAGVLAAGIAGVAIGAVFGPRAQRQVDDVDDPPEREQAFVNDEKKKGRAWMAAGAVVAAGGIALVVTGAVLRGRQRKASALRVAPAFGPGLAGLVAGGRF